MVLIKPGDILLLGNLGEFTEVEMEAVAAAFKPLGIHGVMFSHDIKIDGLGSQELLALLATTQERETQQ